MFVTYSLIVNRSDVYNNYVPGQRTHSLISIHIKHTSTVLILAHISFSVCALQTL